MDAEELKATDLDHFIYHLGQFQEDIDYLKTRVKEGAILATMLPTAKLQLIGRYCYDILNYAWIGDEKGHWVRYIKGKWHDNVATALSNAIQLYIDEIKIPPSTYRKGVIMEHIKHNNHYFFEQMNRQRHIINFKNGFLDTVDFSFDPDNNDQKHLFTYQIPFEYKPDAESKVFLPWLYDILEGDWDRIDLMLKFMGYCLTLEVKFQKILILKGPKRTGKSTVLNVLAELLGPENRSTVPLQRLARRFGTMGIVHKPLNYYVDISTTRAIGDTSKIKILVDEEVDVEFKGGALTTVKNVTKHVFSTNRLPPVKGLDLAYARRFIIVEFLKEIAREDVIPGFDKIITEDVEEMQGIISLIVDAYEELCEDGYFKSQTDEEVYEIIMMETDSVYRFIRQLCDVGPQFEEDQEELYLAYTEFATADGALDIMKKGPFTSDLKLKGYGTRRSSQKNADGKRPYLYTGLKLKESEFYGTDEVPVSGIDDFLKDIKPEITLEDAAREEFESLDLDDEDEHRVVEDPFNI